MHGRIALVPVLVACLLAILPGKASAAESVPALQWPAPKIGASVDTTLPIPNGNVTLSCQQMTDSNLKTYSSSGQVEAELRQTDIVDGVPNCISFPDADKNGDIYGVPFGYVGGSLKVGSNILAYRGNTLKWKYPTNCGQDIVAPKAGADGNIYFVDGNKRLIGLTPGVAPGTTQPKKVLDIATSASCIHVVPFRNGIATVNSGWVYFYSYGGKYLGMQNGMGPWINAEGRLFFPTHVGAGTSRGIKVSAYNPFEGRVGWTAPEASFGQAIDLLHMHPTPDGGVVVVVRRTKVVAGAPTAERVYALVKIGPTGLKQWDRDLPSKGMNGNTYTNPRVVIDAGGRVIFTQDGMLRASNGTTQHGIAIAIFNVSGVLVYEKLMHGNLDANAGEVTGYRLTYGGDNRPRVGLNTLFIHAAKCPDSSCAIPVETRLYPIAIPGLGMEYPRGVVLTANTPAQPAPIAYVALGDSYSSGDGVLPFESGSDTETNQCRRSELAYANLVSKSPHTGASLVTGKFSACSGAETKHITTDSQYGELPQISHLNGNAKVVTISIGGNDIGFKDFGTACVIGDCNFSSSAYATATNKIKSLPDTLKDVYRKILGKAPEARILVLSYPQVAPVKTSADLMDARCPYLYWSGTDSTGLKYVPWEDAQAARDVVTKLNAAIAMSIEEVQREDTRNQRLRYVEVNGDTSPFAGHTVCATPGDSYFNNLDQWVGHPSYALHPNAKGQQAYGKLIVEALRQ